MQTQPKWGQRGHRTKDMKRQMNYTSGLSFRTVAMDYPTCELEHVALCYRLQLQRGKIVRIQNSMFLYVPTRIKGYNLTSATTDEVRLPNRTHEFPAYGESALSPANLRGLQPSVYLLLDMGTPWNEITGIHEVNRSPKPPFPNRSNANLVEG